MNATDPDKRKEQLRKAAQFREARDAVVDRTYDPDWWLKSLIEREKITGLGPEALLLRTEDAQLDEKLAACRSEQEVRSLLQDFNRRVVEARRQLEGGPPVVTPLRDVELAVNRWRVEHPPGPRGNGDDDEHSGSGRAGRWIARLKRRTKGRH